MFLTQIPRLNDASCGADDRETDLSSVPGLLGEVPAVPFANQRYDGPISGSPINGDVELHGVAIGTSATRQVKAIVSRFRQ